MKYLAAFVIDVGRAEEPDGGSLGRRYRSFDEWGTAVSKLTGQCCWWRSEDCDMRC